MAHSSSLPTSRTAPAIVTTQACPESARLNHALHLAAVCQIRQPYSEGRAYFDRKVEEGKTKKEALRALKRQTSNAVYRQLLADTKTAQR